MVDGIDIDVRLQPPGQGMDGTLVKVRGWLVMAAQKENELDADGRSFSWHLL